MCSTLDTPTVQNISDFQVKSQVSNCYKNSRGTTNTNRHIRLLLGRPLVFILCPSYWVTCSRCSPGITAHWKLSLFDCWGLMEVACKKQPLYNVWSMQRMETRRYLWIRSPVTRIPHIWWRLCRSSWFVLPCYANCKVVLCCFVSAGPQTETSSRPNSCSRISHTSKHLVATAYTKWYKCANLHIICAGFPAGFE